MNAKVSGAGQERVGGNPGVGSAGNAVRHGARRWRFARRVGAPILAALGLLLCLPFPAHAASYTCSWRTNIYSDWTSTTDWLNCNSTYPDNTSGNTYDVTIASGVPTLVSTVTVGNVGITSYSGGWQIGGFVGTNSTPTPGHGTVTGNLSNAGVLRVDQSYGLGGSTLAIGGKLTNAGNIDIGSSGMSASTTLTAASLDNTGGTIYLNGGTGTSSGNQAALIVSGAAPSTLTGTVNLSGNSRLQFGSASITALGDGTNYGRLTINGTQAFVANASAPNNNSALSGLATINNNSSLELDNGASVATTTGLDLAGSSSDLYVGTSGTGGSSLTVGGKLTNAGYIDIGSSGMSASTTLNATSLDNTVGIINLQGGSSAYSNAGEQAALIVSGAAQSQLTGTVSLSGNSRLQFGSASITALGDGTNYSRLTINGTDAFVADGTASSNSALSGLATINQYSGLELDNGASVTTTTGTALTINGGSVNINSASSFSAGGALTINSGSVNIYGASSFSASGPLTVKSASDIYLDTSYGVGGSSLTVQGVLTNAGYIDMGDSGMSASSTLTATGLDNTGNIDLQGNSSNVATLKINGNVTNSGGVTINNAAALNVDPATYTQSAGTTTVNAGGTLSASDVVLNGGTLQGDGTVVGNVTNSATVMGGSPYSTGTLTVDGNFTNTAGGTVATYEDTTANSAITVTNGHSVDLQGGTLQSTHSGSYAAGQTYTVMSFQPGSLSGLFASLQNGNGTPSAHPTYLDLGNGLTLNANYNNSAGNVQLTVTSTPASTAETWSGGTGNWGTAGQWSSGVAPSASSDVGIGTTTSGDVTLNQDATVNSLAIHNGNSLHYDTTTDRSLTVGTNTTIAAGGSLTVGTGSDTFTNGGTVANGGTLTVGAGATANVVNLGAASAAVTNQSGGQIQLGGHLTAQGTVANDAGATVALQGGTLSATAYTNAGTTSGYGTVDPGIGNTGNVEASGGTLVAKNGIQGSTGNVTVASGATLDLSQSGTGSSASTLANNGTLDLGSQNVTVSTDYTNTSFGSGNSFNAHANVTGSGQILAAGNTAMSITGTDVSNGTTATPTLALGNVHVGTTTNASFSINNTGTSGPSIRGAVQNTGITDSSLTLAPSNYGPIAAGGTQNESLTYKPTTAGALSGQTFNVATNFDNVAGKTVAVTGAAYNLANPVVQSSLGGNNSALDFGVVQVGQTVSDSLTITNALAASNASYQEGLNASFGTISNTQLSGSGSITNLAAGTSSNAMSVNLTPTSTGQLGGNVKLSFASNGSGTSGLGITQLPSQTLGYTWSVKATVINQASPSITPTSIDFGNVRIGSSQSQALGVSNVATTSPQASLDAQLASTTGAATSNRGTITHLAAGGTDSASLVVGLNTAAAGVQSGAATVTMQSDATPNGCTSNCSVGLPSQNINVTGKVFRLASGSAQNAALGAVRVGGTLSGSVAVTNTAATDGYSENLDAAITGHAAAVNGASGTVTGLAAGATNSTGLSVALDTSTAGHISGTATVGFKSDGTGIDGGAPVSVGSQTVNVTGDVYTPAVAQVNTSSVNFGILHVGDSAPAQAVSVTNAASQTALNDTLVGGFGTVTGPFSGSGTLGSSGVTAGSTDSSSLSVGLNTATAGIFTGSASLNLASHDSALANLALNASSVSLRAQVNNYAKLAFSQLNSVGQLSGSGNTFTLNFGTLSASHGSELASLAFLNDNPLSQQSFTDLLSSTSTLGTGSGFTFSGAMVSGGEVAISGLKGGVTSSAFGIAFDPAALSPGAFSDQLTFDVNSSDTSFSQTIGTVTLALRGTVVSSPVPEPGSLFMMLSGLAMLGFAFRRRPRRPTR